MDQKSSEYEQLLCSATFVIQVIGPVLSKNTNPSLYGDFTKILPLSVYVTFKEWKNEPTKICGRKTWRDVICLSTNFIWSILEYFVPSGSLSNICYGKFCEDRKAQKVSKKHHHRCSIGFKYGSLKFAQSHTHNNCPYWLSNWYHLIQTSTTHHLWKKLANKFICSFMNFTVNINELWFLIFLAIFFKTNIRAKIFFLFCVFLFWNWKWKFMDNIFQDLCIHYECRKSR